MVRSIVTSVTLLLAAIGIATQAACAEPTPAPVATIPASGTVAPVAPTPSATPSESPLPQASVEPEPTGPASPRPARLGPFSITAKRVAFYSNRYVIGADGDVNVRLGDGTNIRGNTMFMDLRLNRFVVAGDVKLTTSAGIYQGAAFSEYFDFDRSYFVPVTTEPDRWTYVEGRYADPLRGRQMPGDTFFLPDLSGQSVFIYTKKAVVEPHQSVRFTPATINFGLTFVPFPTYFLNFSPNPNFAQNALPGADIDGPYDFAGGDHALATAHVRYDYANKLFFAYEQHQVSENHYLVFSVNPLTRPLKQYNLLGFDRLSPNVQIQVALQESAFQHDFSRPLSATGFASIQLTAALRHSYVQLNTHAFYDSLLAQPQPGVPGPGGIPLLYYGDPSHNWVPNHPNDETLSWYGFRNQVGKLPLFTQLRTSIGLAHDGISPLFGGSAFNNVNYPTEWNHTFGFTLLTQPYKLLADNSGRRRDLWLTGTFDKQREWFSLPHYIDSTIAQLSLSRAFTPQVLGLVNYTNTNVGDYWGARQVLVYVPTTLSGAGAAFSPQTGEIFPGYSAFRGLATTRSFVEQLVFTPTTRLNMSFSMRENADFPVPIPGQPLYQNGLNTWNNFGVPPYQATADVRYRINNIIVLDLARSYFFNFGGYERWSPQFYVQILR